MKSTNGRQRRLLCGEAYFIESDDPSARDSSPQRLKPSDRWRLLELHGSKLAFGASSSPRKERKRGSERARVSRCLRVACLVSWLPRSIVRKVVVRHMLMVVMQPENDSRQVTAFRYSMTTRSNQPLYSVEHPPHYNQQSPINFSALTTCTLIAKANRDKVSRPNTTARCSCPISFCHVRSCTSLLGPLAEVDDLPFKSI